MACSAFFARNYPELCSSKTALLYRKETLLQSIGFPWSPTVYWPLFYWFYSVYGPSCINISIPTILGLIVAAVIRVLFGFFKL